MVTYLVDSANLWKTLGSGRWNTPIKGYKLSEEKKTSYDGGIPKKVNNLNPMNPHSLMERNIQKYFASVWLDNVYTK